MRPRPATTSGEPKKRGCDGNRNGPDYGGLWLTGRQRSAGLRRGGAASRPRRHTRLRSRLGRRAPLRGLLVLVYLAHIAAKTERIRLATGAVILPWNIQPLRVAEKAALLDTLC